jgi:hypothetical protein
MSFYCVIRTGNIRGSVRVEAFAGYYTLNILIKTASTEIAQSLDVLLKFTIVPVFFQIQKLQY